MSDCRECAKAEKNPLHGVYLKSCAQCGARHLKAARPSKRQQELILSMIARKSEYRDHKAAKRKEILKWLKMDG